MRGVTLNSSRHRKSSGSLALTVFGGGAGLVGLLLGCGWFLLHDDLATHVDPAITARLKAGAQIVADQQQPAGGMALASAASTAVDLAPAPQLTAVLGPTIDAAMLDITSSLGTPPSPFSNGSQFETIEDRFVVADAPATEQTAALEPVPTPAPTRAMQPRMAQVKPVSPKSASAATKASESVVAKQNAAPAEPMRVAALGVPVPAPRPSVIPQEAEPPARTTDRSKPVRSASTKPEKAIAEPSGRPAGSLSQTAGHQAIFDKLFGKSEAPAGSLAYAPTDGGVQSDAASVTSALRMSPPFDRYTAVYDISAKKVYMPDGSVLEAHSGRGQAFDNPKLAHLRNQGPTPPHLYTLKEREAIFYGVRAIRLHPVGGEKAIWGRNGLLAHTYLYGPRGESFGCVSFKDYAAFLRAYDKGQVKRLAVLSSIE